MPMEGRKPCLPHTMLGTQLASVSTSGMSERACYAKPGLRRDTAAWPKTQSKYGINSSQEELGLADATFPAVCTVLCCLISNY